MEEGERNYFMTEKYNLKGINGNAFSILSYVALALKKEGKKHLIRQYHEEAVQGDYDNLLQVSLRYIDVLNAGGRN